MTVARLLREMTPEEFIYWQAYDRVDPFGEERADWRNAVNTAANINLHISRNSEPAKVAELMWSYEPRGGVEITEDPEELARKMEAAFSMLLGPMEDSPLLLPSDDSPADPYELATTTPLEAKV